MNKKVFIYCRVSGKEQIEGNGWQRQEDAARKFCAGKEWIPARVFKEQQTGADEYQQRKQMSEMLILSGTDAATGIDTVVVEGADRIARDLIVQELFLRDCRKKGIKVYAADSGEELVNAAGDATRTLIRQLLGALAQWEKAMITKRLQDGRRKVALRTGKPCGGPAPYINEGIALEIKLLKEYHLKSFSEIAADLNKRQWDTPSGKWGVKRQDHPNGPFRTNLWSKSTVHKIYQRDQKFENLLLSRVGRDAGTV